MPIAAAIIAGGRAARMGGVAKGLLAAGDGVSIIERLIAELTRAGLSTIVISANDPGPYRGFNRPIIADRHCGIGPLGGVEAVLSHLGKTHDAVFLLPCDLPNFTAKEILRLFEASRNAPGRIVVARTSDGDQPLCAVVPTGVLPQVEAAIAAGEYGVGRLWRTMGPIEVSIEDAARLTNINTPEDLRHWQGH